MAKFYLTTTLPYVNSDPHLGFALEMVQADIIVRYHKEILGEEVFFNTGTDEHGLKIQRKAEEQNMPVQDYVDGYAEKFKQLMPALGILPEIHFIRTTDEHHIKAAQEFWRICAKNGDIYKKNYKVKYCVGCELEKTESELDQNGKCLIHPHLEIEEIEEENYFFRWSKYEKPLLDFYEKNPSFVVPDFRFNEIKQFVKGGLQDFSISRLKEKMSWGIPVPDDEKHVMYVWFDALINYVSTLGWPMPAKSKQQTVNQFEEFWGTVEKPNAIQIAGKDNLRQQSAMWQAMLMSAGLSNSKQILIHGFINSGGQKMSKSLGNVADPYQIIEKLKSHGLSGEQAVDALRYYLAKEIPTFEDGDYTWERFVEVYNADLANGIGNQFSRVMTLAVKYGIHLEDHGKDEDAQSYLSPFLEKYQIKSMLEDLAKYVKQNDVYIQETEVFKMLKADQPEAKQIMQILLRSLNNLAKFISIVLPNTSQVILKSLNEPVLENIPRLFPRI